MASSQQVYEVRPRTDHRGVDLSSDALPFGRLWYEGPGAVANAEGLRNAPQPLTSRCDSRLQWRWQTDLSYTDTRSSPPVARRKERVSNTHFAASVDVKETIPPIRNNVVMQARVSFALLRRIKWPKQMRPIITGRANL